MTGRYSFVYYPQLINKNNDKILEIRFYDHENLDENITGFLNYLIKKYNPAVTSKTQSYRLKENVYIYYQDLFRWPDIKDEIIGYEGSCHGGIDMLAINSRSDVTLCCLDPYAHNRIGNLKENY